MRLACPNCDARYEVPDDAIPEGGRDVQCSNCGHGWFQLRPEDELAMEEAAAPPAADLPTAWPDDPDPEPEHFEAPSPLAATPDRGRPEEVAVAAVPATAALEDSVLAVLREEAEREAEARRLEAQRSASRRAEAEEQMQVQPDLGLGAPAAPALSPTQRRLAMLKGEDPDAPPPAPAKPPARRDLLPDVEEINSTLQPGDATNDADAEVDALPDLTRRASFRSGFLLAMVLLLAAAAIYIAADSIAELVPGLRGPLDSYVGFIDSLRLWLNALMDSATAAITGAGG